VKVAEARAKIQELRKWVEVLGEAVEQSQQSEELGCCQCGQ